MGVFVYILKNNNMNTGSVLFFVFTLLSIVCGQCTYTASNGCTYDLSGLTIAVNQPTSAFYTGMDTSNSTFYFNICGALNSELSTGFSTPPGVLQETLKLVIILVVLTITHQSETILVLQLKDLVLVL